MTESVEFSVKQRDDFRFGGVSLTGFDSLAPGDGKLSAYEYYPWDDPEFERDPNPWYERAQQEVPVLVDDAGTFVVSRYADLLEFGALPFMSVEQGWEAAGPWSIASSTIIGRDGDDHTRMRRALNPWFAPKSVREWVTTTAAVTQEILDQNADGLVDGWLDVSLVATHKTICRVLKVDDADPIGVMHEMAKTMPMLAACPRAGTLDDAADGFAKLAARADAYLLARETAQSDGLTDALITLEKERRMSHEEMRATLILLYGLGHMDVGYFVAACLRALAELPDVYSAYREHPELRDAILNEVVRMDPPELCYYRTTLEDVTIGGVGIPAGSRIRFMLGAANRDPEVFLDPNQFNYERPMSPKTMSFNFGTHTCPGQGYSRAQARAVVDTIADRFKSIELAGPFRMDNTDFSRHFLDLPLRLNA